MHINLSMKVADLVFGGGGLIVGDCQCNVSSLCL